MVETALILSKTLHFAAAMLLWGGVSLYLGVPPRIGPPRIGIDRVARPLALLNLMGAAAWFLAACASAGNGPQDALNPEVWRAMLTGTRFGMVWGPHLAVAAALALWSLRPRGFGLALLAGLNLGSIGLTGHAVLPAGGLGLVHQALSVLHLLAAGFWIGALPFALALLRGPGGAELLLRFSKAGHWAVALVIATGLARMLLIQTSRAGFDPGGMWSLLLALKALLVAGMAALALNNRYRLVPKGAAGLPALRRGTGAEIALGGAVLVLASLLATLSPFGSDP